jgi:hypothetical protein
VLPSARGDEAAGAPSGAVSSDRVAELEKRIEELERLVRALVAAPQTNLANEAPAMTLTEAIRIFNLEAQSHPVGKDQPPLTVDEVVAGIRWYDREDAPVTDEEFAEFRKIADTRRFPAGTRFEVLDGFIPGDGYRYTRWSVRVLMPRTAKPGWTFAYSIRERTIKAEPVKPDTSHEIGLP